MSVSHCRASSSTMYRRGHFLETWVSLQKSAEICHLDELWTCALSLFSPSLPFSLTQSLSLSHTHTPGGDSVNWCLLKHIPRSLLCACPSPPMGYLRYVPLGQFLYCWLDMVSFLPEKFWAPILFCSWELGDHFPFAGQRWETHGSWSAGVCRLASYWMI